MEIIYTSGSWKVTARGLEKLKDGELRLEEVLEESIRGQAHEERKSRFGGGVKAAERSPEPISSQCRVTESLLYTSS